MTSASIDTNTWFQVTESRVDFNSSFMFTSNALRFVLQDKTNSGEYWMFYQLASGNYAIRNKATATDKQLGVCYVAAETDASKTQPCMQNADVVDSQEWIITNWSDGNGYKFVNKANGTGYNLDWHPGKVGFMNEITAITPNQPAQHWLFSSLSEVNDGAYSTAVAALSTSSSAAKTTSSSISTATDSATASSSTGKASSGQTATGSSATATGTSSDALGNSAKSTNSHGLSAGAGIGIGVGIGIAAIVALLALGLFLYRRKSARKSDPRGVELSGETPLQTADTAKTANKWPIYAKEVPGHAVSHEMYTPGAEHEMYAPPAELDSGAMHQSSPPSYDRK